MALFTYIPYDVTVNIAGLFDIEGWAEGTFIEIEKEVSPYTYQSSMDGETSRTFVKDDNYKVTITLAQSSPSNNLLNAIHSIDVATQLGKLPLFIKDGSGSTKFFSPNAWIENVPAVTLSESLEPRKWVFKCTQCTMLVGGQESDIVADLLGLLPTVEGLI